MKTRSGMACFWWGGHSCPSWGDVLIGPYSARAHRMNITHPRRLCSAAYSMPWRTGMSAPPILKLCREGPGDVEGFAELRRVFSAGLGVVRATAAAAARGLSGFADPIAG